MMLSKSCQYALKALLFLAQRPMPESPMPASEIAKAIDAPEAFLAKTLQHLNQKGLVSSVKGNQGGFFLTPAQSKMRLSDVIQAIDGDDALHTCLLGTNPCNPEKPCILHRHFVSIRKEFNDFFTQHRIESFRPDNDQDFSMSYCLGNI